MRLVTRDAGRCGLVGCADLEFPTLNTMKKPFERLTAHGCAIYAGEKQVATTDPGRMSGADGDEMPSMEDIARAKMLAAAPDAYHALWSILRCAKIPAPHGISAYAIPDDLMDKARGALLLGGIER